MQKTVRKTIKLDRDGIHVVGGLNMAINANIQRGDGTAVTSQQDVRIVQKGNKGRTHTGAETDKEVAP